MATFNPRDAIVALVAATVYAFVAAARLASEAAALLFVAAKRVMAAARVPAVDAAASWRFAAPCVAFLQFCCPATPQWRFSVVSPPRAGTFYACCHLAARNIDI